VHLERVTRGTAALLLLAGATLASHAQLSDPNPDWKEAEVMPPPLRTEKLVPITLRRGSVMRWGVDPASISIGGDGVVRYVVVAQGDAGAINALYEGVRCSTAEVKVYARSSGTDWVPARDADWKPLHGNGATVHSLTIARDGACVGHGANRSPEQIARDLGRPHDQRFRNEYR
jgi:CNP1-like family